MPDVVYRIRRPEVVSEVFEGEAVVVDLRQGLYYALSPLASELWQRLEGGATAAALARAAAAPCGGEAAAAAALAEFLPRLVAAGLLVTADGDGETAALAAIPPGVDPRLDYEAFDDLEDLLVLDPIHELDENGWPLAPGARDTGA